MSNLDTIILQNSIPDHIKEAKNKALLTAFISLVLITLSLVTGWHYGYTLILIILAGATLLSFLINPKLYHFSISSKTIVYFNKKQNGDNQILWQEDISEVKTILIQRSSSYYNKKKVDQLNFLFYKENYLFHSKTINFNLTSKMENEIYWFSIQNNINIQVIGKH